ncbi:hypothetical protein PsorP6_006791 [Peronosclerospora sorghi]|uniref:Uncharacterized protein n=1 Tax=Peronosclerospora sorghi TaxID=230839 RepID=A0ACC0W864_9STRA|nr:hypothetical protein PsorP6_006791 [Peronosclerospora sorghi]
MELSLLPPPISLQEQTFSSRKDMERALNNFAVTQGYGIEHEAHWDFKVQNAKHNHDPSTHPSAHPVHLRLRPDISEIVVNLYESGFTHRNIQSHVRKGCDGVDIPAKTIHNRCQKTIQKILDGRTPMDALIRTFRDLNVTVETKNDAQHQVVYAKTESEFDELWTAFQTAYCTEVIQYIQQTWIDPHKHRFVRAWTDRVPHFGHAVTSRGESAHRMIKQYLPHSMNKFLPAASGCTWLSAIQ